MQGKRNSRINQIVIKFDKILTAFEDVFTGVCFVFMTVLVLAGVLTRFVLHIPFMWSEEASRYLMVAGTFVGISIAARDKSHLGLSLVVDSLPHKAGMALKIFSEIICIVIYCLLAYYAIEFLLQVKATPTKSAALSFMPMWVVYIPVALGLILTIIRVLMLFWNDHISKDKPLKVTEEENWAN